MKANETLSVEKCCKVSKKTPLCESENVFCKLSATETKPSCSLDILSPFSQITFSKVKHNRGRKHETRRGDEAELEREMELWKLYRDWQNTYKRKGAARDVETVNAGGYNVKIPVSPLPYCSSSSSTSIATTYLDWGVKHADDIQSSGYGTPTYDPECIKRRDHYKSFIWKEKDKLKDGDKDVDKDKDMEKEKDKHKDTEKEKDKHKDTEKEKDKHKDTEKEKDKHKDIHKDMHKDVHKKRSRKAGHETKDREAATGKKKTLVPKPPWLWTPSVSSMDDTRSIAFERLPTVSIGSCSSLFSKLDEMCGDKDGRKQIKLWPEEEVKVNDEVPEGKKKDTWLKKLQKLEADDADDGTLAAFEEPLLYRYPSDAQVAGIPYGGAWAIYMKEKENELLESQVGDEESTSEAKIPLTPTESIKIWQFPPTDDTAGEVTIETPSVYGECTPRPPNTSPVQISGVWALTGDELAREQREWDEAVERDRIIDDMERQLMQDSEGECSVDTHISDTTAPSRPPELDERDKRQTWWEINHTYRRGHSAFSSTESLQDDIYNIDDIRLVGSDAEEKPNREDVSTLAEEEQPDSTVNLCADEEAQPLLFLRRHSSSDEASLAPSKDSWDAYEPEEKARLPSKRIMERPHKAGVKKKQEGPAQRRREVPRGPQVLEKQRRKASPKTSLKQVLKKPPRPSRELPPLRLRGAGGSQPVNDLEMKNQEKNAAGDSWEDHMPPTDDWIALYKETMRRLHLCAWGRDPDGKRLLHVEDSTILPLDTTGGGDTRKSSALMQEVNKLLSLRDTANEVMRSDRSSYIDVFQGEINVIVRTVHGDILVVDVEIMKQLNLYKGEIESIGVRRFVKKVHLLPPLSLDSIFGVFLWSSHVQAREGDIADETALLSESDESDDSDSDLFSESVSSVSDEGSEGELTDEESNHATSSDSDKKRKMKNRKYTEDKEFATSGGEQRTYKKTEVPKSENAGLVKRGPRMELELQASFFEPRRKRAVVEQTLFEAFCEITRQSGAISKDPELSEDTMALLHAIVSGASTGRLRNMLRAADALGSWSLSCAILRLMGRAMAKDDSANMRGLVHSLTQGTWLPYFICHTRGCFLEHLKRGTDYKASYMENYPSPYAGREKNPAFTSRRTAQMPSPRSSISSSLDSEDEGRHAKVSGRPKASSISSKRHTTKNSTLKSGKKKGRSKVKPHIEITDEV